MEANENINTNVKYTYVTKSNKENEYHIDYYNNNYELVGHLCVSDKGVLTWYIGESNYEARILKDVSFIYGDKVENTSEFISYGKLPVKNRWDKIKKLINTKYVNNKQNTYFNEDFYDEAMSRNR